MSGAVPAGSPGADALDSAGFTAPPIYATDLPPPGASPSQSVATPPPAALPASNLAVPDPNEVFLVINGVAKTGWQRMLIVSGIEIMPSQFSLEITDGFATDSAPTSVEAGDDCTVMIGSTLVLTGTVDRVRRKIGRGGLQTVILGRSKCRELVDCDVDPAQLPGMQLSQSTVLALTQRLAGMYHITAQALGGVGSAVIQQFNVNLGAQVYSVIEEIARYAQVLAYDAPDGSLNLAPVGVAAMASGFAEGVNIEEAAGEQGADQRYSCYELYLTSTTSLTDIAPMTPLLDVYDPFVAKFRKHIIISEQTSIDPSVTQKRGVWERNRRYGRSNTVRLTCDSWRDVAGSLWTVNTLAPVNIPRLGITGQDWLIAQVAFRRDDTGTHADLVLMPPTAFATEPVLQVVGDLEINAANARAKAAPTAATGIPGPTNQGRADKG